MPTVSTVERDGDVDRDPVSPRCFLESSVISVAGTPQLQCDFLDDVFTIRHILAISIGDFVYQPGVRPQQISELISVHHGYDTQLTAGKSQGTHRSVADGSFRRRKRLRQRRRIVNSAARSQLCTSCARA